jgi:hypothetical protein
MSPSFATNVFIAAVRFREFEISKAAACFRVGVGRRPPFSSQARGDAREVEIELFVDFLPDS